MYQRQLSCSERVRLRCRVSSDEPRMTPKQLELLRAHHDAPARVISATRLAESVGFRITTLSTFNTVCLLKNLRTNSRLTSAIVWLLDLGGIRASGLRCQRAVSFGAWSNVVQALEDLGWARRDSHLLSPEFAVAETP